MSPVSSLFTKILSWFFLNMILVAAALAIFFAFQPQLSLYAIFDQQGTDRLRTTGLLIIHDLGQIPRDKWADGLARHAAIHRVDFTLVLEDESRFSSTDCFGNEDGFTSDIHFTFSIREKYHDISMTIPNSAGKTWSHLKSVFSDSALESDLFEIAKEC